MPARNSSSGSPKIQRLAFPRISRIFAVETLEQGCFDCFLDCIRGGLLFKCAWHDLLFHGELGTNSHRGVEILQRPGVGSGLFKAVRAGKPPTPLEGLGRHPTARDSAERKPLSETRVVPVQERSRIGGEPVKLKEAIGHAEVLLKWRRRGQMSLQSGDGLGQLWSSLPLRPTDDPGERQPIDRDTLCTEEAGESRHHVGNDLEVGGEETIQALFGVPELREYPPGGLVLGVSTSREGQTVDVSVANVSGPSRWAWRQRTGSRRSAAISARPDGACGSMRRKTAWSPVGNPGSARRAATTANQRASVRQRGSTSVWSHPVATSSLVKTGKMFVERALEQIARAGAGHDSSFVRAWCSLGCRLQRIAGEAGKGGAPGASRLVVVHIE